MWEKLRVVFTIPELRQKILLTLLFLAIYRIGWHISLPIVDSEKMAEVLGEGSNLGAIFRQMAVFSASQLNQATIFGLGIMPYISASIIFQLLGSVWAPLERLKKEGAAGQKKINEYTRYATVVLCLIQSYMFVQFLSSSGFILKEYLGFGWQVTAVLTMTCGTVFLMWLGEQIDEFGIGNGISLLIMAGILARMPGAAASLLENSSLELGPASGFGVDTLIVLAILFIAVIFGVVFITLGQRRIRMQSAKHIRGRKLYGAGSGQYLPLRVNQSGVMPIIFASSLLLFPSILFQVISEQYPSDLWQGLKDAFQRGDSFVYNVTYVGMIYFFCYFWTAITFNPKEVADNLKDQGTFIPGYRPGKRTADYLEKVMVRITYVGAGFLALVAITPTIISASLGVPFQVASFFGGTGLLIAVSVAFDLVQKIDSHLVMRNYRGLLDKS